MNSDTVKNFLSNPLVKEAMKTKGVGEVALMAIMAGNLGGDQALREFGQRLLEKIPKGE